MKLNQAKAHMKAAYAYAELSYCKRRQVGCVIVKDDSIIAIGYNGTSPGDENVCEDKDGISLPNVIHAEDNALRKLIRSTNTAINSTVFVTTCPCVPCARRLVMAGVSAVYYDSKNKGNESVEYLESRGISTHHLKIKE